MFLFLSLLKHFSAGYVWGKRLFRSIALTRRKLVRENFRFILLATPMMEKDVELSEVGYVRRNIQRWWVFVVVVCCS